MSTTPTLSETLQRPTSIETNVPRITLVLTVSTGKNNAKNKFNLLSAQEPFIVCLLGTK